MLQVSSQSRRREQGRSRPIAPAMQPDANRGVAYQDLVAGQAQPQSDPEGRHELEQGRRPHREKTQLYHAEDWQMAEVDPVRAVGQIADRRQGTARTQRQSEPAKGDQPGDELPPENASKSACVPESDAVRSLWIR